MMARWIRILAIVLGLQVLLAGLLWWGARTPQEPGGEARFVDWSPEQVTALTIEGPEGRSSVTLERRGGDWVIARLDDLPAAGARIEDLLRRLHEARVGAAVGTTASALKRFRVADQAYERRLTLRGPGNATQVLYVGESAGPGRVYARVAGRDTAHELGVRRYEIGDTVADWADKSLLQVDAGQIERVSIGEDVQLVHTDKGWGLAGSAQSKPIDQKAAQRLIDRLARISFNDVLPASEAHKGESLVTVRIERKQGKPVVYRIYTRADENKGAPEYLLRIEGKPWWFVVPGYAVAALVDADRDKLLGEPQAQGNAGEKAGEKAGSEPGVGESP